MRHLFIGMILLVLASCGNSNEEKKTSSKAVSRHSAAFNASLDGLMKDYYSLTEAFVNWDSGAVAARSKSLETKLGSLSLEDVRKDSGASDAAQLLLDMSGQSAEIAGKEGLTTKRHRFNELTQNLYNFLNAVQYDEKKIYLQECPMAFNDSGPGDWLSESESIRNPYMGLHHPTYGSAMVDCGNTKLTIDFTSDRSEQSKEKAEDKNSTNDPKKPK